jgi:hypothetical protein
MVQSVATAPHVTTVFEADLSAIVTHREAQREGFEADGVKLTYTAYFVRACVAALQTVPEVNSRWHDDARAFLSRFRTALADRPLADFLDFVELNLDALDRALAGVPPARVRMHVCWGNYEGPHHYDIPLADLLDDSERLVAGDHGIRRVILVRWLCAFVLLVVAAADAARLEAQQAVVGADCRARKFLRDERLRFREHHRVHGLGHGSSSASRSRWYRACRLLRGGCRSMREYEASRSMQETTREAARIVNELADRGARASAALRPRPISAC